MNKKYRSIYSKINIKNSHSLHSIFGGLFIILFLFFVLSFSHYHTYIFLFKLKIEYIHTNTIIDNRPFINLTDINFNLGFILQFTINGSY